MLNGTATLAASAGLTGDGAATPGRGGALARQPDSLAEAEVTPSETVSVQSGGAEKTLRSSLDAPFPSAVLERAPGVPATVRLAPAPLPSMPTLVPCSSARLIEVAAWAGPAAASTPSATATPATATPARQRGLPNSAPVRDPVWQCRPVLHQPVRARGVTPLAGDTQCHPLRFGPCELPVIRARPIAGSPKRPTWHERI